MSTKCASCGATIDENTVVCSKCGNNPRRDVAHILGTVAMVSGLASLLLPPLAIIALLQVLVIVIFWVTATWILPAQRYDIQFGLLNEPSGESKTSSK